MVSGEAMMQEEAQSTGTAAHPDVTAGRRDEQIPAQFKLVGRRSVEHATL